MVELCSEHYYHSTSASICVPPLDMDRHKLSVVWHQRQTTVEKTQFYLPHLYMDIGGVSNLC